MRVGSEDYSNALREVAFDVHQKALGLEVTFEAVVGHVECSSGGGHDESVVPNQRASQSEADVLLLVLQMCGLKMGEMTSQSMRIYTFQAPIFCLPLCVCLSFSICSVYLK